MIGRENIIPPAAKTKTAEARVIPIGTRLRAELEKCGGTRRTERSTRRAPTCSGTKPASASRPSGDNGRMRCSWRTAAARFAHHSHSQASEAPSEAPKPTVENPSNSLN